MTKRYEKSNYKRAKRNGKMSVYSRMVGYKCSNPDCEHGLDVESHHVFPKKNGGPDEYWNIISLCKHCHRSLHLHSKWEEWALVLFAWKTTLELSLWGFYLDERDPEYYDKLKKAIWQSQQRDGK